MESTYNSLGINLHNRFKQVLFVGCLCGVLAHLSCVFYFYFTDVRELFYYDICVTIYFILLGYLIHANYNLKVIFIAASIEMVIHGYLCSYYVGYDCDFIFFVLALPCVFLLDNTWKTWQLVTYLTVVIALFSFNYILFQEATPVYVLSDHLITKTSVVMSFTTACMIFAMLFYFSKVVQVNENSLKNVCLSLKNKDEENKAMLKEIHHRVKNNLQVINSLLSMQSRFIEDENVVAKFKESQKRIMTIAAIHEKLYNAENLKELNVEAYITSLSRELIESYSVHQNIKLDLNIEPIYLGLESLVPLGLIINEIITNSLKHAFNDHHENIITLSLVKKEASLFEMIIRDNGKGYDITALKKGLGQKLVSIFVKQLDGTIELLEQKGTAYKITFKEITHV
jgi:two-component sensor histidine kinase